MKHRLAVIQHLEQRLPVIEDRLRSFGHADGAGMAELRQHVRDAEQMHSAVPMEITVADENEIP